MSPTKLPPVRVAEEVVAARRSRKRAHVTVDPLLRLLECSGEGDIDYVVCGLVETTRGGDWLRGIRTG